VDADPAAAPRSLSPKLRLVARTTALMAIPSLAVLGWALFTGRLSNTAPEIHPRVAAPSPIERGDPDPPAATPPPAQPTASEPPPSVPAAAPAPSAASHPPSEPFPAAALPVASPPDRSGSAGAPEEGGPDEHPPAASAPEPDPEPRTGRSKSDHKGHGRPSASVSASDAGAAREAYARGNESLLSGDITTALQAYREAIALDPENPSGYRGLGLAYAESGDRKAAMRFLRAYLSLAPKAADRSLVKKRLRHLMRQDRRRRD
jgi:hypothetical protein